MPKATRCRCSRRLEQRAIERTPMHQNPSYRAVVCSELGPPERLKVEDLPCAELTAGTARVKMIAAGINFPDFLMVGGIYQHRPDLPFVPGMEGAGVISEVSTDVTSFSAGQNVMV